MGEDDKQKYIAVIGDDGEYPAGLDVDEAGRVQNFPGGIDGYQNPNAVKPAETELERQQVFAQISILLVQLKTIRPSDPSIEAFAEQLRLLEEELTAEPLDVERLKFRRKELRKTMTIAGTNIQFDSTKTDPFVKLETLIFMQLLPGEVYRSY